VKGIQGEAQKSYAKGLEIAKDTGDKKHEGGKKKSIMLTNLVMKTEVKELKPQLRSESEEV